MGAGGEVTDLSLVTTEDLTEELCRRFETAVVLGHSHWDEDRHQYLQRTKGDHFALLGLCDSLKTRVMRSLQAKLDRSEPL